MIEVYIGKIIKQKRLELGYTQEQLCQGICEPISISRIERGLQNPSKHLLDALMQRLGMPSDRYYALLSKNEQEISDLQKEIISCNTRRDYERGLAKISELEAITDPEDTLVWQFILRSKVILGKKEGEQIVPYSFEEELEILFQAIRLTSPHFDIENICEGLYTLDEVKIINQIACSYSDQQDHKTAIDIYYQLLKYIQKHFQNILQSGGLLPLVAYNYSRELNLVKRYQDSIEIAQLGWKACITYGQYRYLPNIITTIAECYHFLGDDEKSKDYYKQAYYIHKALDNQRSIKIITSEVREYFGTDFQF